LRDAVHGEGVGGAADENRGLVAEPVANNYSPEHGVFTIDACLLAGKVLLLAVVVVAASAPRAAAARRIMNVFMVLLPFKAGCQFWRCARLATSRTPAYGTRRTMTGR
jgi:hypothetical protein